LVERVSETAIIVSGSLGWGGFSSGVPSAIMMGWAYVFRHLDEAKPGAWEQWRLVHFFALVMNAAERK
jgi:hypothetical protein